MLKKSFFHTNSRSETFASLINCVIDDALLETMPDIEQTLFQFIDVMNLLNPLLHFSHIFVVSRVQICAVGWLKSGVSFQKVDCPTRSVSRNIALLEDKELAIDLMHDRR